MELHIKIAGVILVLLALSHTAFPKYFNWGKELRTVSMVNRQMIYVHTFFIGFVLLLTGLLCLSSSTELIETDFGNKISIGLGVFWLARLLIQFFGFSSKLWKGKRFETRIHILFSVMWTYLTVIFFVSGMQW